MTLNTGTVAVDSPSSPFEIDDAALFAAFVRKHETACPRCGYSLKGLLRPTCPECGDELKLEIALVEPKLGSYIVTLVVCSIGLGGSLLFGTLALRAAPRSWWHDASARFLLALMIVGGLGVFATLIWRRAFRRCSRSRQLIIAVLSAFIVATLASLVVITFDK